VSVEKVKILVDRFEGMPSFYLRSVRDDEVKELPLEEQRKIIEQAHKEWEDFTLFIEKKFWNE
jgi:hypothetical protein